MRASCSDRSLTLQIGEGIAWLTFEQPQTLNALTPVMAGEFLDACRQLRERDDVRVLVMRGSGRAFMAGGDLQALRRDPAATVEAIIPPMHEAILLLKSLPLIVLARLHGAVAGAGLSVACLADLAIAESDTRFVYAYADIATTCALGLSWHLVRRLGLNRAMEIALLSKGFDAEKALAWGLINRIEVSGNLDASIEGWAVRLAARPSHVISATRNLLQQAQTSELAEQLDLEHQLFAECAGQPEFAKAIDSFFANRLAALSSR